MLIRELAQATGVSPKTIRYYKEVSRLPSPERLLNGYRKYAEADVRRLDFSLAEISEILDLRDKKSRRATPCLLPLHKKQKRSALGSRN